MMVMVMAIAPMVDVKLGVFRGRSHLSLIRFDGGILAGILGRSRLVCGYWCGGRLWRWRLSERRHRPDASRDSGRSQ